MERLDNELERLRGLKNKYIKLFEDDKVDPVLFAERLDEIHKQIENLNKERQRLKVRLTVFPVI